MSSRKAKHLHVTFEFFDNFQATPASCAVTFLSLVAAIQGRGELNSVILSDGQREYTLHYDDVLQGSDSSQLNKFSVGGVYEFKNLKFAHCDGKLTMTGNSHLRVRTNADLENYAQLVMKENTITSSDLNELQHGNHINYGTFCVFDKCIGTFVMDYIMLRVEEIFPTTHLKIGKSKQRLRKMS